MYSFWLKINIFEREKMMASLNPGTLGSNMKPF